MAKAARTRAPWGSEALDYKLELACVVGQLVRDLPPDDSAMECVAGFTVMNLANNHANASCADVQPAAQAIRLN